MHINFVIVVLESFEKLKKDCREIIQEQNDKVIYVLAKNVEATLLEKIKTTSRFTQLLNTLNNDHSITNIKKHIKIMSETNGGIEYKIEESKQSGMSDVLNPFKEDKQISKKIKHRPLSSLSLENQSMPNLRPNDNTNLRQVLTHNIEDEIPTFLLLMI